MQLPYLAVRHMWRGWGPVNHVYADIANGRIKMPEVNGLPVLSVNVLGIHQND